MAYPKRLIEVDLPIRRISEHARRDQNIRKGHLHSIHVWWATRPLASCRAVLMATLLPDPADPNCPPGYVEKVRHLMWQWATRHIHNAGAESLSRLLRIQKQPALLDDPAELRGVLLEFIADFAAWDAGVDGDYLRTARGLVAAAHPDGPPLVLDPFAGAGSIPFEALRVGAQAFAGDLNPVAILINKVALEYLPKYGRRLAEGVEKWGNWVLNQARKRLTPYYPADSEGHTPLAYIWARTITCEGPGCGAEVPLLGMLWLSRKSKNLVALRYRGDKKTKQVQVEIFSPKSAAEVQPPIVKRMAATCPCCGYTTPYKRVREQLRQKRGGTRDARMIAVITLDAQGGRHFRLPNEADLKAVTEAREALAKLEREHQRPPSFVPHEPTMQYHPFVNRASIYGIPDWAHFFTERQALALSTFAKLVGGITDAFSNDCRDPAFATAVATCVALALSNTTHYSTSVSFYSLDHMISCYIQGCGFPMRPDFAEANPLMPNLVGGFEFAFRNVCQFLQREAAVAHYQGTAMRATATRIPLPDQAIHYIVTDPPYYYTIQYADSSDLPYVWLKRAVGNLYADLFATELTPKDEEIIVQSPSEPEGEGRKNARFYEREMQKALTDCRRVLTPSGVSVVLFAHKQTAGWEALLSALIGGGWTVTASWPIETERRARLRAGYQAMLASTVFLICRPVTEGVGDWREVLAELPKRIHQWMPRLVQEGVVGADAIFACLGPALELFSRYSRVEKVSGEQVSLREYLEEVWAAVSQEALRMVFEGADASTLEEDARLTAMWLWTLRTGRSQARAVRDEDEEQEEEDEAEPEGNSKKKANGRYALEFDAARKIAQSLGAHLENLSSVVAVEGETARLLAVSERAAHLFGKDQSDAPPASRRRKSKQLKFSFAEEVERAEAEAEWGEKGAPKVGQTTLDRVHQAMLLFATGRSEALRRFLVDEGVGRDGKFWTLAQALSALYPAGSPEKRWVDGVLARKKGLGF